MNQIKNYIQQWKDELAEINAYCSESNHVDDNTLNEVEKLETLINSFENKITYDKEINILKNFLWDMPNVYRRRNENWVIVRDILMAGTSNAGMSSCIAKCRELRIDPYGYSLENERSN